MGDTLRRELSLYGIPVSIIEPGNVKSAIWFKLEKKSPYAGTDFGSAHQALLDSARAAGPSRGSDPLPISEAIYHALTATKPRKRYLMPGSSLRAQVRTVYAPELVPGWWGDRKMSIRNDG
jgi:NAD(P)-dependent dehydrogenase (short-subunit alcohol dehydrogenase family)